MGWEEVKVSEMTTFSDGASFLVCKCLPVLLAVSKLLYISKWIPPKTLCVGRKGIRWFGGRIIRSWGLMNYLVCYFMGRILGICKQAWASARLFTFASLKTRLHMHGSNKFSARVTTRLPCTTCNWEKGKPGAVVLIFHEDNTKPSVKLKYKNP